MWEEQISNPQNQEEPTRRENGLRTLLLRVDAQSPDAAVIEQAAEILRGGGLVAFPTETVYGLGANAWDAQAVAGIYAAKGRPSNNPLILHVANVEAARQLVTEWPETAARLAERFWPGPLTLVLPKNPNLPDNVTGGGPTVGVRVPAHPVALALLRSCGLPIAAPSANLSEQLSPTRAEHVMEGLNGRIHAILDGGATTGGLESTVLNLTTKYPTLLRPGLITPAQLEAVVGPIKRRVTPAGTADANAPLPAPGLLARHYAPRAPLEMNYGIGLHRVKALLDAGEVVGWLCHAAAGLLDYRRKHGEVFPNLYALQMPDDPEAYAALLYDRLHELDNLGVTRIIVDAVPNTEVWLAIRDRLQRATAK